MTYPSQSSCHKSDSLRNHGCCNQCAPQHARVCLTRTDQLFAGPISAERRDVRSELQLDTHVQVWLNDLVLPEPEHQLPLFGRTGCSYCSEPHLEHGGQVLAPAHEDAQVLQVQLAQAEQDARLLVAQVDALDLRGQHIKTAHEPPVQVAELSITTTTAMVRPRAVSFFLTVSSNIVTAFKSHENRTSNPHTTLCLSTCCNHEDA